MNIAEHGASSSILELAGVMQTVAESGQYDLKMKVKPEVGTEVGDLGSAFNEMLEAITMEKARASQSLADLEIQKAVVESSLDKYRNKMEGNVGFIERQNQQLAEILDHTDRHSKQVVAKVQAVFDQIDGLVDSLQNASTQSEKASELCGFRCLQIGDQQEDNGSLRSFGQRNH